MNEELEPILIRLVEARKPRFSQRQAAEKVGLASQQALSRIEHGKRDLTVTLLLRLCHAYSVSPQWILTGEPNDPDTNADRRLQGVAEAV